jgi:hypothetical protein
MGAGYFVIAIMGCGDGSAACMPVATVPTHYASESQCNAATVQALTKNSDFDFPTLVARCRSVDAPVSSSVKTGRKPETLALRS